MKEKKIDPQMLMELSSMRKDLRYGGKRKAMLRKSTGNSTLDKIREAVESLETDQRQQERLLLAKQVLQAPDVEVSMQISLTVKRTGLTVLEMKEALLKDSSLAELVGQQGFSREEVEEAIETHVGELMEQGHNFIEDDFYFVLSMPRLGAVSTVKQIEAHLPKPNPEGAARALRDLADSIAGDAAESPSPTY